jgi:acyl-CoA thioester hydrolase
MKKIEYTKPIYTYEIDASQHVSNIAYIQWMEVSRLKLLNEVGLPVEKVKETGFTPALIRTEIDYKRPLFIGDEAKVVMWISELRRASLVMTFEFFNRNGDLVATAKQSGLFIDLETQRPHKLTKSVWERFKTYLASSDN